MNINTAHLYRMDMADTKTQPYVDILPCMGIY